MHINSNVWSRIALTMNSNSITECLWHNIFLRLYYNMYTIQRISVVALELLQQAIQLQIKIQEPYSCPISILPIAANCSTVLMQFTLCCVSAFPAISFAEASKLSESFCSRCFMIFSCSTSSDRSLHSFRHWCQLHSFFLLQICQQPYTSA